MNGNTTKFLFINICIVSLFVLKSEAGKPVKMPVWFWETPQSSQTALCVGYSIPYDNIQSSYNEAFEDAAWRLFVDRGSHITGGRAMLETPEGMMAAGGKFTFLVDSSAFEGFSKSLVRIDSAVTADLVVMLVGNQMTEVDQKWEKNPGKPDIAHWKQSSSVVAQGMGERYLYESSSWQEAERTAREEAALLANSVLKILEKRSLWISQSVYLTETDVYLWNVQTIARGIDTVSGSKIVIIRTFHN